MKRYELFNFERPDDQGAGNTPDPDEQEQGQQQAPPTPPPEQAAPQLDPRRLDAMEAQIRQIASYFEADEEEEDASQYLPEEVQRYIQQTIAPYTPHLQTAVTEAGTRRMNEIFDAEEKELGGKFDRKLAEKVAHGFLPEVGDPVEATKQAAKFAFELKKQYGQEAVDEYKASLKKGHGADPDVSGAGETGRKPAKSYDEVIDRWAAETEV